MKIILIGYYYSPNLGDAVIADCVRARLHICFPDAEIVIRDIWGRTKVESGRNINLPDMKKQQIRQVYRGIMSRFSLADKQFSHEQDVLRMHKKEMTVIAEEPCDAVVFAGGQLLTDLLFYEVSFYIHHFSERGIPVYLNALGTGPVYSRNLHDIFTKALHDPCVHYISVRDHVEEVNRLYNCKAVSVTDPALFASTVFNLEKADRREVIGLGIMLPYSISSGTVIRFWVRLIRELDRRHISWGVFLNGSNQDYCMAIKVLSQIPAYRQDPERKIMTLPKTPYQLVEGISHLRGLISFRLHSHIIATSLGVPSTAIVWDDKVRAFFEKIGHSERCLTVHAAPDHVIDTFLQAEKEGLPTSFIEQKKKESELLLFDAIRSDFPVT